MAGQKVIIGLTGSFGSGCTTVSSILGDQGFKIVSISQLLKKEAEKQRSDFPKLQRKEIRKVLQDMGNQKREKSPGILIREAFESINPSEDIVIESIKNPGEIRELKKWPNSYVVALDTSFETRVTRILDREYDGDKKQMEKDDLREKDEGLEHGQKLQECVDLADIIINNDKQNTTSREEKGFAEDVISRFVKLMKQPGSRYPTDKELWMNNAYSLSLQSSCLKRQIGAIIIKEGYQIATGRNDVASGEHACKKEYGLCYRDKLRKGIKYCPICGKVLDSDYSCKDDNCDYNKEKLIKLLDRCRALHAEESAILQASSLGGVSLRGSILVTTTFPCKLCANKILSVGIKEVIYVEAYPDKESVKFFQDHSDKIILTKFEGVKTSAFHKLFRGR